MNYLVTGATGLIGSHTLFHLLQDQISSRNSNKIYVLVRVNHSDSADEPVRSLLNSVDLPASLKAYSVEEMMSHIKVLEGDLLNSSLSNTLQDLNTPDTIVIHCAASTNLFHGEVATKDVKTNNYEGTIQLAKAIKNCAKFVFVSTAYSFGMQTEPISDDYFSVKENQFRNSYEQYKNKVEGWLIEYFDSRVKIARPSIVCGRLLDAPLYVTSKFDVIYGWGKFFYKMKHKVEEMSMRIHMDFENEINVIPVDYFVKVMMQFAHSERHQALNIVNKVPIKGTQLFGRILEVLEVTCFEFVKDYPQNQNPIEKAFYKSAGDAFSPYTSRKNVKYNTSRLDEYDQGLDFPEIMTALPKLFGLALERKFTDGYITNTTLSVPV